METRSGPWQLLHPLPDRAGGPIGHRLPGSLLPLHLTGIEPWSLDYFPVLQLNSPPVNLVFWYLPLSRTFRMIKKLHHTPGWGVTAWTCVFSQVVLVLCRSFCHWICTNFIWYCWLCSTHLSSSWMSLTSSEECAATFQYSRKTFLDTYLEFFNIWVGCTTQY